MGARSRVEREKKCFLEPPEMEPLQPVTREEITMNVSFFCLV